MFVTFTIQMDDIVVDGKNYDHVEIVWRESLTQEELDGYACSWMSSDRFLTRRMIGLERVGESMLTINPDSNLQP